MRFLGFWGVVPCSLVCNSNKGYVKIKSDLSILFWRPWHFHFLPQSPPLPFASVCIALSLSISFLFPFPFHCPPHPLYLHSPFSPWTLSLYFPSNTLKLPGVKQILTTFSRFGSKRVTGGRPSHNRTGQTRTFTRLRVPDAKREDTPPLKTNWLRKTQGVTDSKFRFTGVSDIS